MRAKTLHSKHFEATQDFQKIAYNIEVSEQFQSITEKAESAHDKRIKPEFASAKGGGA